MLIVTLYAVHHKFFDPYLEKARNNLCKGASSVEPTVVDHSAHESQPLSNTKPSHVVVNPAAQKNDDYATASVVKAKSAHVKAESRHGEDTIAESSGQVPNFNKSAIINEDVGKNNSEADF